MKKNKQAFHGKYFERNWNNVKNTWKGIKSHKFFVRMACHSYFDVRSSGFKPEKKQFLIFVF